MKNSCSEILSTEDENHIPLVAKRLLFGKVAFQDENSSWWWALPFVRVPLESTISGSLTNVVRGPIFSKKSVGVESFHKGILVSRRKGKLGQSPTTFTAPAGGCGVSFVTVDLFENSVGKIGVTVPDSRMIALPELLSSNH